MKHFKFVMLSALITLSAFCAVWYSSCTKDNCKGVTCLNHGNCSGGSCVCPTGAGGTNCEIVFRTLYTNIYTGTVTSNFGYTRTGNTLTFSTDNDTVFTNMRVIWNDNGRTVSMPIVLSNTSNTGSSFMVTATTVDTNTYTGNGTISATSASMTLTESHPHSPSYTFMMNNFTRQ